jgi:superfamily I DNA and/or RNA helicase
LVGGEEGALSYYRDVEVDKVVSIIKSLQKARPLWHFDSEKQLGSKNSDGTINDNVLNIGIMSFYKEQIAKINAALKDPDKGALSSDDFYQIKCGTVDTLQGKEFDIVILSTTRSNARTNAAESLGFIHYSKSRINVALSRARRLLIIVGDMNTMGRNDSFSKLIDYTKKVGIVEGEI